MSFHGPAVAIGSLKNVAADDLPRLKLPVLWISGTRDPSQGDAARDFTRIPKNKLNRHVTVDADYPGTPDVSGDAIIAWLATLN